MKKLPNKRIIAIAAAVVLLLTAVPVTLSSDGAIPPAEIPGVDYTRVNDGYNTASMDVSIALGPFTIPGRLECGNCISREDSNKIISQVMAEKELTSRFLSDAHKLVKRTAARYSLSAEEVASALSGPAGNYISLTHLLCSSGNIEDAGSLITGVLAGSVAASIGPEAVITYIVGALGSLGYTELLHMIEALDSGESASDIAAAVIAAAKLGDFYSEVNKRLDKFSTKKDSKRLIFDGAYVIYPNQTFMGVGGQKLGMKANGILTCDKPLNISSYLNKSGFERQTVFTGTYTGSLQITIDYLLDDFDRRFRAEVFESSRLPFSKMNLKSYGHIADAFNPTVLQKKLTCDSLTLEINARRERYGTGHTTPIPLGKFRDESTFHLDHRIIFVPDILMPYLSPDGTLDLSAPYVKEHMNLGEEFWFIGGLRNNRYTDLIGVRYQKTINVETNTPGHHGLVDEDGIFEENQVLIHDCNPFYFLSSPAELVIDATSFNVHN